MNGSSSMFGRSPERGELLAALDEAGAGRGRLVLVRGDAGIGKTRLCEEIEEIARGRGAAVAWGHALEGGAPPYWPWVQIMRALGGGPALDGLGDVYGIVDAVLATLRARAQAAPVLLLFEDLHLASASTLELLKLVAVQLRDLRVLAVATFRDAEVRMAPALDRQLAELARRATTIALRRLDRAAIGEIMSDVAGGPLPALIVNALYDRSGGNPLFARELARYLGSADPSMSMALAAGRTLPPAIADLVAGRVELLPAPARALLEIVSIGAHALELELVAAVAGCSRAECLSGLDAAQRAGLAVVRDGGEHVELAHTLARDALYRSIALPRRAELHLALARAAEASYMAGPEPRYAELAHHFSLGAAVGGREQARRYHRLAGEAATARLAHDEAARHFERALAAHGADDAAGERAELMVALAEAQLDAGDVEHGVPGMVAAAAQAGRTPALIARAALALGSHRAPGHAPPPFARLAWDALEALGDGDPAVRAQLRALLAADADAGRHETRVELARQALAEVAPLDDMRARATVLLAAGEVLRGPDELAQRLARADELAVLGRRLGRRELQLGASALRRPALIERGDLAAAHRELQEAEHLADAGSAHHRWLVAVHGAALALLDGDLDGAERRGDEARALGDAAGVAGAAGAQLLLLRWRVRRAQERLAELTPELEAMAAASPEPIWRLALAQARLAAGDREPAELRRVVAAAPAWPHDGDWLASWIALAELAAALGDDALAASASAALAPYRARIGVAGRGAAALRVAAVLAPAPPARAPAPSTIALTLREAEWLLTGGGVELTVRDSKGMRYLAELLAQPGRDLHVTELAASVDGADDDRSAAGVERLRQSITKRVREAIKRIAERDARIGDYLERAIRTGTVCVYDPPASLDEPR